MLHLLAVVAIAYILHLYVLVPLDKHLSSNKTGGEFPQRLISLLHATITSSVAVFYTLNLMVSPFIMTFIVPMIITAYFIYDYLKSRQVYGDDRRRRHNHHHQPPHPYAVLIHHVFALAFFCGILIVPCEEAIYTFCLAELSIVALNIKWFLKFFDTRRTKMYEMAKKITIYLYFLCRVVLFPVQFLIALWRQSPYVFFHLSTYISIICLSFLYLLNVKWFITLLGKKQIPFLGKFQRLC